MSNRQSKTPLIYALEPRLLFDGDLGADVASAIIYRDGNTGDTAPAVAPENQRENISFEFHSTRSAILFIDGALEDTQTLAAAAADHGEVHILDGARDGFDQINDILQNHDRVDEIHIFGHGTAGEARLGTASLSLETLTLHSDTLAVLKDVLTDDGDILLYGCNIATGEDGEAFIEELAELTASDIAASDDITGTGGDWELEVNTGPIESNAIEAWDYQYALTPDGVTDMNAGLNTTVIDKSSITNLNVNAKPDNTDGDSVGFYDTISNQRFVIALENSNITSTETLYFDFGVSVGNNGSYNVSSSQPVASYLVALNNDIGRRVSTGSDANTAAITFEHEVLGYYVEKHNTLGSGTMVQYSTPSGFNGSQTGDSRVNQINNSYFANSNWTYPDYNNGSFNKRDTEGYFNTTNDTYENNKDYVWFTNSGQTLNMAADNGDSSGTGDFIRVITKWSGVNAQDDFAFVNEGGTVAASDGASASGVTGGFTDANSPLNVNFIGSTSTDVEGVHFNNDGTKLYLNDQEGGDYQQYSLLTPFDVSSATSDSRTFDGPTGSRGLAFNSDGTKAFTVNYSTDLIYEYSLSSAFNIDTASQLRTRATADAPETPDSVPEDLAFSSDGTKLYYLEQSGKRIYQLNLSTAYNISGASDGGHLDISDQQGSNFWNSGLAISPDGRKLFAIDNQKTVFEWFLQTADDITSAALVGERTYSSHGDLTGISFSNDGTKAFMADATVPNAEDAVEFNASIPFSNIFAAGGHSGDLLHTSRTASQDSGSNLFVNGFRKGGVEGQGTFSHSNGGSLDGDYGTLTMQTTGEYSYTANSNITNLDAGEVVYDQFNYKASDSDGNYDQAVLTITIVGQDDSNNLPTAADNTVTIAEEGTHTFDASEFNFADVDSDSLVHVTIVAGPAAGTLTLNGSAVNDGDDIAAADIPNLVYTPVANGNGDPYTTFQFKVNDGTADSASAHTMTIDVTPVNDLPTAADNTVTINEDATKTFDASEFNFADVDSDSLVHVTIVAGPAAGTLTLNGSAVNDGDDIAAADIPNLVYTPVANGNGDPYTTFQFKVNDGTADSASAHTMTIDVTPVNDLPTAADNTVTINEDATKTFDASEFNFADVDSDSLVHVTIVAGPAAGTLTLNGSAVNDGDDIAAADIPNLVYTPVANGNGDPYTTFQFKVNDGTADSASAHTMTVDVTPVNDAPTVSTAAVDPSIDEATDASAQALNESGTITFADEDANLTISGPASATVTAGSGVSMASDLQTALAAAFSLTDNNDNTAAWTLSTAGLDLDFLEAGQTITLDYVVTATDANAETVTDTITATITGTNDAPVATSITTTVAEYKTTRGASLANASLIGPTANDSGIDGYQTGHQSVMPLDMSFSANGQKLFVLGPNKIFTYNLTDAWDVGDWTYASEFDLSPFFLDNFFPGGVEFNDDGTRVFVSRFDPQISDADGKLISFDLSTAYDLSTASLNSSIVIPDTSGSLRFLEPADGRMGLEFSSDGLSMFMLEQHRPHNGSTTFEHAFKKFTLSTAWDISTADTSNPTVHTFLDSHDSDREAAFTFNGSGTRLFVLDVHSTSSIREYSLSTPYDISNLTLVGERSLDSEWFHSALYDIALSADESKLYLSGFGGGSSGGYIYEFSVADSVLLNDTDPEGHALTVTQIGSDVVTAGTTYANGMAVNGQYGVLTIGADGSYRYVADGRANETVTDSFSYTVSDGTATNTANLVVTVVGTNDAPTTADAAVTTNENTAVVLATSNFTFTDVDTNDAMTHITIATLPANGALEHYNGSSWVATTQNQNITKADLDTNYLRFTPPTDEHGAAYTSFTFTVNDGQANSAPATLTLNITSVNEAPVAVDDTIAATSGSDATGTVLSNDSDPDGTTPSLSAVETGSSVGNGTAGSIGSALPGTYGSLTLNTDGTYTYVTDANHTDVLALSADDAPLTETFTYTITDGTETDTAIITVNVSGVNDAPTATNDTIAATSGSDATGTLLSNDSDPDGTTPSLSAIETGSSVGGGTAGSIGSALPGTYGSLTLNTDGTYTYVTDANHTDVLALSAGDAPLTETFTYTITDGTETDTATITVNVSGVNDAPVAVDDTIAATSGSDATGTLLSNDSDPDGTTPSLSAIETGSSVGGGTAGSIGSALPGTYGSLTLNSDGTYSFTVDADNADVLALGADDNPLTETFIYTITDGTQTDTAIITVNVSGVNDAPTAADETVYINERNLYQGDGDRTPANTSKTFAASDFASFSDSEDSDFSTIRISSLQTGGDLEYSANGSTWADVTENQIISHADMDNGQLRFTPDRNEEADVSFGFQLSDSTDAYSAEQTMTISVNAAPTASNYTEGGSGIDAGATDTGNVRDVPISDNDDADSVLVLTGLTAGGEFSNWENDTDLITDGTGIGTGVVGSYGTLQMASDGAFTYTANATNNILSGNTALDQFTFTVRDDETNAGSFAYDVGTLSFRVNGFDEAPVAVDDTIVATSGSDATGTILSNDSDPDGTTPSLSAIETGSSVGGGTAGSIGNALPGTYGSLTLNADGTYTYVTDTNHVDVLALGVGDAPLTETFTYTITDGTQTDTAIITVNVSGVNDAPTATNDTIAATSGSDATGTILSNDSDPDGTTPSLSAIETGSSVGGGTAGSIGNALPGTYGSLTLNADGTYTYVTDTNHVDVLALGVGDAPLTETFTYTITDGTQTDTAIITVNVSGVNDAPVATNDTIAATSGSDATGTILSNDSDPDGTTPSLSAIETGSSVGGGTAGSIGNALPGTYGSLTLNADGTYTYVTDTNHVDVLALGVGDAPLTETFTYTITDGTQTDTAIITVNVSGVNDAPTATNDTIAATSGSDATGTILSNDSDPDGTTPSLSAIETGSSVGGGTAGSIGNALPGTYGSLTLNADGTYTYVTDTNHVDVLALGVGDAPLTETFTYTITDGTQTDTAIITVNVSGVNDAPVATNDTIAATSGSDATGTVLSNDSDPDGTTPNLSAIETGSSVGGGTAGSIGNALPGTYGSLTLNTDGTYTYVTDTNHVDVLALGVGDAPLTETFTYTITDGTETDTATITVNVSGVNDAPTATNDTIAATSGSDATGTVLSNDSDPDGTTPNLSAIETGSSVGGGTAGSIGNALPGTYGSLTLNTDGTYTYVTDTNHVDVLALGVGDAPLTETFTYTITDGTETDTATITVNVSGVNDAPVAADDTANIIVGIEFTGNAISGSMSGADSDLDANSTLTVSALGDSPIADTDGASASATSTYGTLTLGRDGSVTYTADQSAASQLNYADAAVTDNFTYTVSDGNGGTDTATISFSVTAPNPTNTLPTAADNTLSISEDASITFVPEHFNFNDADGDRLRQITIVSVPQVGTLVNGRNPVSAGDTLSVGEIENLSYSPASNANGTGYASLTFRVNDGTADSAASYTMTFDITAQNDAPTAADNGVTIDEDTSKSFSAAEFGFADIDSGAALDHITIASLPTAGTLTLSNASVNVADDIAAADIENLQFTPDAHDNGIPYASFTFRVHDGTQDSQTTNTMTVNVTPVNDAPTTTPLSNASSKTDADYTFDLLQGATDLEADALSVTGTPDFVFTNELGAQVPLPAGAAVINGNNVEISPAIFSSLGTGEDVSIVINYVLSDGDKSVNNSATITISGGNTQPQIIDATNDNREGVASVRTNEDTMFTFAADQFNFSDADANDTLSHVTLLTLPENGVLRLAGDLVRTGDVIPENQIGTLTFTPDENGHGETYASFRYLVSDGTENSAAGTMSLHVDAVNDLPTTENGRLQLNGEDEIALSGRNFAFADIEGDSLHHVTIVSAPTEGTLYLNNQPLQDGDTIAESQLNLLTYKPGENASGVNYDAFTFSVNDGEADSASAATITIGVNAAPVASDSSLATNEGQPKRATLLATDHDDANLQYTITKQPNHGTLELIGGGPDYIYTPDAFYYGSDNFKFVATDTLLTSEEAVVSVTVQPVNNAPMERLSLPAQAIMLEGKVKPIKLEAFFGDVDAFDPSNKGFKTNVTNLLETGKFPARAKFNTMPLDGALTFTVESPLPPGLSFNGRSISGRPTKAGVYDIIMQATDGLGLSVQSSFQLFVGMPVTDPRVEAPQQEPPREDAKPEETISDLNEHDLPRVLKVNPKRDGKVPLRDAMAPDPIVKDDPAAALGNSASLAVDAWMQATVSSEPDLSGNIRVVDLEINGQEIAVQLTDGAVDQAATFKGEMADGSKLPDWVQVDPNTGLTIAEPPQGAKPIEMLVIANDGAGNERAINLVLNPEGLLEDAKETPPSARETRQERREARQAERQAERQTRLEARAERTLERRETRAIRDASRTNTEFSVLPDGRVRFVEGLTAVGEGSMKLMRMVSAPESVTIEITDTGRLQTTRYEVRQQDGTPAPDWVQVDAATGALIIEAPQNAPTLQLTLVAVDGTQQRSVDLDVDLDEMREDERAEEATPEAEDIQTREPAGEAPAAAPEATIGQFLPLDKQIDTALIDNDYGQDLQAAIQARSS